MIIEKSNKLLSQRSMEKFIIPDLNKLYYKNKKYYEQADMIVSYAQTLYKILKELRDDKDYKEHSLIERLEANHIKTNLNYNGITIHIEGILKNGWGRNMLSMQIDNGYHLRIGVSNNNFENTLPALDSDLVNYTIKDPYIFDFLSLKNEYKEKELENAMINKIRNVLIELGKGFSFVGN